MIKVIETSSEDRQKELEEIFEKMRPLLDQGFGYIASYQFISGVNHTAFSRRSWWRDLVKYGEEQGYDRKKIGEMKFKTGLLNVVLHKVPRSNSGYVWKYICNIDGMCETFSHSDLRVLEEDIIALGLPWAVVDEYNAQNSYDFNYTRNNPYLGRKPYSGVSYVYRQKQKRVKRGYVWIYRNPNHKSSLSSSHLTELKKKVEERGWEWRIVDDTRYNKCLLEDVKNE